MIRDTRGVTVFAGTQAWIQKMPKSTLGQKLGKTPLIYAIKYGKPLYSLIAPRLFKEKTLKGKTPLHYAAKYKRNNVMEELLDRGGISEINEVDNKGNTALFYAIYV